MKRRDFLKLSAILAGFGVAGGVGAVPASGAAPAFLPLPDLDAMRRIGRRYLELHPDEAGPARELRARLDPDRGTSLYGLRWHARAAIREDLARHDVVALDGWIVPRALARVCSAVALA